MYTVINRLLREFKYRRGRITVKDPVVPELADVQSDYLNFVPQNVDQTYHPTFAFSGYIDGQHEQWANWKLSDNGVTIEHPRIFGWLRREDAAKLYEMAALCRGDILELGTHQGLSAHIMAGALATFGDRGARTIHTIDLDPAFIAIARENLAPEIAQGLVDAQPGEAAEVCRGYIAKGKRFGFVFVDHSHYYGPMCDVCKLLADLTEPGGFVLFHDFTDPRSTFPAEGAPDPDFGVLAACVHALPQYQFEYFGAFGCTGLFRRRP